MLPPEVAAISIAFQKLSPLSSPNASAASARREVCVQGASTVTMASPAFADAVDESEEDAVAKNVAEMIIKKNTTRSKDNKIFIFSLLKRLKVFFFVFFREKETEC